VDKQNQSRRILLLASNFCGNIGDLFIFEAVCDFLIKISDNIVIDVYPYPLRYDSFVALPSIMKYEGRVEIIDPAFKLRRTADRRMRQFPFLQQFIANNYFNHLTKAFKIFNDFSKKGEYDHVVVVGGEMDLPFSLLDVHAYVRSLGDGWPIKNITYGPISIVPKKIYDNFLQARFSEVEQFAVRDPLTLKKLNELGITNNKLIPDCAFLAFNDDESQKRQGIKRKIGLCLHSRWGFSGELSDFVSACSNAALNVDCELIFFVTNLKEDAVLVKKMLTISAESNNIKMVLPTSVSELKNMYADIDIVISDRLHGILIGMLSGCVVVPLATRDKVRGYCEYLNIDKYLKGDESANDITETIMSLYGNIDSERFRLKYFMEEAYQKVSEYYMGTLNKSK